MRALLAGVIALTLAAATVPAAADEPPSEPEAVAATPLEMRPSKPLALASPSEGGSLGYKVLAGLGIAAGAGLWLRKKRGQRPVTRTTRIDILGRTSLGVRSELLVVEVEGTRLLVGMTPGAIQPLAVLDSMSDAAEAAEEVAPADVIARESPVLEVADRARALLGGVRSDSEPAAAAPAAPRRAAARQAKAAQVAGQAKGLLLALEPPAERAASPAHRNVGKTRRLGDW